MAETKTPVKEVFSNQLSDAQLERLAILSEELGEAQQCIGKILRHGYESYNPLADHGTNNRGDLQRELGDVKFAIQMLEDAGDVSGFAISERTAKKSQTIKKWLHYQ